MQAIEWIIVGLLMIMTPAGWSSAHEPACAELAATAGPPAFECTGVFVNGEAEITVLVWQPAGPIDGGPMVASAEFPGRLLGQDITITRTSHFMGQDQETLVAEVTLASPGAQVLIHARNTSPEAFQAFLDGVRLNE